MRNSSRIMAVVALVALAACSQSAKVTKSGDTTTVTTDQGQVTVGKAADSATLGVPMYPGATQNEGGSVQVTSAQGSGAVAAFKTTDPFDKVYEYYKSHLPADAEKMKTSSGNASMAMFSVKVAGSNDVALVQVTSSDAGTAIVITRGPQK